MNANAGGSLEDLSALEEPSEPMGTSGLSALHKLENLRIDKLKQLRKPLSMKGVKLPSIPGAGKQRKLLQPYFQPREGNEMNLHHHQHGYSRRPLGELELLF